MMEHLSKNTALQLELSDEDRINHIRSEKWVGYTRSLGILGYMEDLLTHPPTHRMPNMLLVGDTNNGKTMIVRRFCRKHEPYILEDVDGIVYPVLYIQAPPFPDEKRFYNIILDKIGAPFRLNDRVEKKQFQVLQMLAKMKVKLLIIDEIHHILAGSMSKQRSFLNVIKYLSNELQISIICVGTVDALNAIQTDPQLSNRFIPRRLPKWEMNEEYLRLLASLETLLPLRKPSDLPDTDLALKILTMSEGTIGEIMTILREASIYAIKNGEERITRKVLNNINWVSPSDRRNIRSKGISA